MSSENLSAPYKKGDFIGKKYEVYDVLGIGGFGIVYLVYHHETESVYALKTLRDEYLWDKEAQERFKKEAQIWIDLERHPYLVRASFVQEISGRLFIALEYIAPDEDGLNSLDGYLRYKPPDLAQSLRWAVQLCHGMEYAYSKGIRAHRDIKPANILVGVDKALKITDFGIAGVIGQARISGIRVDIRNNTVGFSCQTVEGSGFGTPTHMPPEQFTNAASCDERSDIYSFGIVLYQMAAHGNLPFLPELPINNSPDEHIRFWHDMHRLHSQAPVLRLNSPLFPIIQKCLEKEPMKRYHSFAELRSKFEPLLKRLTGEVIKVPESEELAVGACYNKGLSLNILGKHQEAIACYDRLIKLHPGLTWVWLNKGVALLNLGKFEEAIVCYDKALDVNPKYIKAWINKGIALGSLGKSQDEVNCYDKVLEINPRDEMTWSNKGVALSELGRHQEAIACFDRAIEINPIYSKAWYHKGNVLSDISKHQEAVACYDRVLEINPRHAEAWYNKGNAVYCLGKIEAAIEAFENFVKFAPTHDTDIVKVKAVIQELKQCRKAEEWCSNGNALYNLAKYQEAIACYDRALEIDTKNADAWNNKGFSLSILGKYDEAMVCYDRAIEINPKYEKAWINKGIALYDIGKFRAAIEVFENSIKFVAAHDAEYMAKIKEFIQELKAKI